MAGSTSRARRSPRRILLALFLAGLVCACQVVERTEPHASKDVLDAILAGMKRAHEKPGAS